LAALPPVPVLLEIGPMNLPRETHRIWAMHREFRRALAELNAYSDRELSELGLSRADVVRVAYEEAERRIETTSSDRPATAVPAWRAMPAN
jgi:uncharacterized protein YjiS (DUF1127 family)